MIGPDIAEQMIYKALRTLNEERSKERQIEIGPKTRLFGVGSELDSLSLVSLISDIETELNAKYGLSVALADDRAMNREVFPFTDVQTLKSYIVEIVSVQ